uniref:Regulatory protein RecX n=1 Tax=Acetithermum autotrophicum TaxID=1446466 RepID=H5SRP5_ACEAU|nr:regulatory protein RecX [Candidatus Acetothermum autotrophicum]
MTKEERARAYLLKLLKHRPRSRHEAFVRLQQKGFSEEIVESVLEQAARAGVLDDAKFAQLWVEDRLARRPRSRRMLERELRAKGVAPEHIQRALARAGLDEEALVRELIAERSPRLRSLDEQTRRRRLVGFLRRRGFSERIIRRALGDAE